MKKTFMRFGLVSLAVLSLMVLLGTGILAADAPKKVGVVVRYSNGTEHLEIVTVPANATTLDVLNASNLAVVTSDFGGGFIGLCKIGGDGCPADNCFCGSDAWAYWHLNAGSTDWDSSMAGIASYVPADKSVEGFSYTGYDESWNPLVKPVVHSYADIEKATQPPAPTDVPEPATLVLLSGGLASLAGYMGLRRRARG